LKITVIINNYNYQNYIEEALQSVLKQARKPDQVIVVDDGSTDDSLSCMKKLLPLFNNAKLIAKKNGGQLSTFNAALPEVEGDVIAFLDSDDWYDKGYLGEVETLFRNNEIDYLFSSFRQVKNDGSVKESLYQGKIGKQYLRTLVLHKWFGVPTSAISFTANALRQILPYKEESDWKTRADDVLVFSLALLGFEGSYGEKVFVNYRIHGDNNFFLKKTSLDTKEDHFFATKRLLMSRGKEVLTLPAASRKQLFEEELHSAIETRTYNWKEFSNIMIALNLSFRQHLWSLIKVLVGTAQ